MINQKMGLAEWGLIITLSALWGSSYFTTELALEGVPPLTLATGRVVFGAVTLYVIARAMGLALPRDAKTWGGLIVLSLFNNVFAYTLIMWGQTEITGSLASIFNAITPLFTILIAHWATRDERFTGGKLTGVSLGIAGVAVMVGLDALSGLGLHVLAELASIGGALSYAIAVVYGRRFRDISPVIMAAGQLICSSIILLPLAAYFDRFWTLPEVTAVVWGAIIWIAVPATALAYLIFFRVLQTSGAVNVILVTFLVPVSAILLGAVFLGEQLAVHHLAGMALIAAGLVAIDGRLFAWLSRRES